MTEDEDKVSVTIWGFLSNHERSYVFSCHSETKRLIPPVYVKIFA